MPKFIPFDLKICVDDYVFNITVTNYVKGDSGIIWGKPENCYEGWDSEVEWECKHVYVEDEDGSDQEWFNKEAQDIADRYAELIEEKILVELEEMKNESEDYYD